MKPAREAAGYELSLKTSGQDALRSTVGSNFRNLFSRTRVGHFALVSSWLIGRVRRRFSRLLFGPHIWVGRWIVSDIPSRLMLRVNRCRVCLLFI